jgi:hypothetical protein
MFDELLTEITAEMAPFRQQIVDAETVRVGLAMARQRRIAAANARIERRFMEGVGEVVASIDADLYHRFGLLYGYDTVNSPDFLRSLLRDNPELRVKSRADAVTLRIHCTDWKDAGSAGVCTAPTVLDTDETTGQDHPTHANQPGQLAAA